MWNRKQWSISSILTIACRYGMARAEIIYYTSRYGPVTQVLRYSAVCCGTHTKQVPWH